MFASVRNNKTNLDNDVFGVPFKRIGAHQKNHQENAESVNAIGLSAIIDNRKKPSVI